MEPLIAAFYHGTPAELEPGDHIEPGHPGNFSGGRLSQHTYFTSSPEAADQWGEDAIRVRRDDYDEDVSHLRPHVYEVEPTGEHWDDWENEPGDDDTHHDYMSAHPLRVVREIHHEAARGVSRWTEVSGAPMYHGTHLELKPGDLIQSPASSGHEPLHDPGNMHRDAREHVFFTSDLENAQGYAEDAAARVGTSGKGHVYQVEPTGHVTHDPEYTDETRHKRSPPQYWRSRHPLKIVRKVSAAAPQLDVREYEGQEGNRRHITRTETGRIPLDWVRRMHGAEGEVPGEHRNKQGQDWEDFKASVAPGVREPVFITVDHGQEPRLSEGSHRRDAAAELGHATIPAYIQYFGHAERQGTLAERSQRRQAALENDDCEWCGDPGHGLEYHEDEMAQPWHHLLRGVHSLHRGVGVHLPAADHAFVHDPAGSRPEQASRLLKHVSGPGWEHMHWSSQEGHDFARDEFTQHHVEGPGPVTHVLLHAQKPEHEHIEQEPRRLLENRAWEHGYPEFEVPLARHAPVQLTGVSWRQEGEPDWRHHQFGRPRQIEAAARKPTKTKAQVNYRNATGSERCGNCVMIRMLPPDFESYGCTLVKGLIEPQDTCDQWAPDKARHEAAAAYEVPRAPHLIHRVIHEREYQAARARGYFGASGEDTEKGFGGWHPGSHLLAASWPVPEYSQKRGPHRIVSFDRTRHGWRPGDGYSEEEARQSFHNPIRGEVTFKTAEHVPFDEAHAVSPPLNQAQLQQSAVPFRHRAGKHWNRFHIGSRQPAPEEFAHEVYRGDTSSFRLHGDYLLHHSEPGHINAYKVGRELVAPGQPNYSQGHTGPQHVGYLSWLSPGHGESGEVYKTMVKEKHRRKGLASAMLDFARERSSYPIAHSTALTEDGKAFAEHKAGKGEHYVTCDQGHEHFGEYGCGFLLIRHKDPDDGKLRFLLQKRSPHVDHGGTWGIPGGALHGGEKPYEGARREAAEEMGSLPRLKLHHVVSDDHGGWTAWTHIADSDDRFDPPGNGKTSEEQDGHAWMTAAEMKRLDLHPGFAATWDAVRNSRSDKDAGQFSRA